MKNMKVRNKLMVGFTTICLFAVIVGAVGFLGMKSINKADYDLYHYNLIPSELIGQIRENLQAQRVALRDAIIFADNSVKKQSSTDELKNLEIKMEELFRSYEASLNENDDDRAYFEAKRVYQSEFGAMKENAIKSREISFDAAIDSLTGQEVAAATSAILNGFATAMDNKNTLAADALTENLALFGNMARLELIVLLFAAVFSVAFATYISALISIPLSKMTTYLERVSKTGDMSLSDEDMVLIRRFSAFRDEIGMCVGSVSGFVQQMLHISQTLEIVANGDLTSEVTLLSEQDTMNHSLQRMVKNLNGMFGGINSSTEQVTTGSKQIAEGANMLAQGSTQQAAAVEELSGSISGISKTAGYNADMAGKASKLSENIKQNAEKGSVQMDRMMEAVNEIQDASKSISKVIKVIDDIAFQTNILALNAAVEAARAGQHGKGFAVVAEEVRNLAAKSAEAAKDTGTLIVNSMEKAELGAEIAGETAASLSEIVSGINESAELISDIAKSSNEQTTAITEINRGIDQVVQVIQQNSAAAEQSAAASEEMSEQAGMLKNLVVQFKLKDYS